MRRSETSSELVATTGGALRSTPGIADPDVLEGRAEIDRQDDYYATERVKWGVRWFFVLLFGSIILDALVCFGLGLGSFLAASLHRLIPIPWGLALAYRVGKEPRLSSTQIFRALLVFNFVTTLWVATTVVTMGGMTSVYQAVVLLVPLTMFIVPATFARAAVAGSLILGTYVATVLIGTALTPSLAHDLTSRGSWMTFMFYVFLTFGMVTTMVVVSQILWSLRREIFESKNIGKYKLRRLLGRGGMGEVWAAYHAGLRREVALKLLGARGGGGAVGGVPARRFEREVQTMVRLSHPNTVRVFDFGAADGGLLYYAMELLDGEHLGRLIRRDGALPIPRARHFMMQAARALAEAHALGIVHRDVKAENLVIAIAGGERDFVKVLDFGIATLLDDAESQRLTQTGTVAGTPGTVSPEVIRGEDATPASDVYALGAVGYLMVTGTLPFESDKVATVMLAHLHDAPVQPSVRRGSSISPAFEAVILRCLAKDPAERYADAGELASALLAIDDVKIWDPSLAETATKPDSIVPKSAAEMARSRADHTRPLPVIRAPRPPSS